MTTWWTVAGALLADSHDSTTPRPLVGAAVLIFGWPDERGCVALWGEARTDDAGRFALRTLRPGWPPRLWIRVRLGRRWHTIDIPDEAFATPHADLGTWVCPGAPARRSSIPSLPLRRHSAPHLPAA